jgi:hypothetical protein
MIYYFDNTVNNQGKILLSHLFDFTINNDLNYVTGMYIKEIPFFKMRCLEVRRQSKK